MARPGDEPVADVDGRIADDLADTLALVRDQLVSRPVDWLVTGGVAAVLHGAPVNPHDIDIETTGTGAYDLAGHLGGQVVRAPSHSAVDWVRSHFAIITVAGFTVEIMGELELRLPDGTWQAPVPIAGRRVWLQFRGRPLPVISVDALICFYRDLGREDKAMVIAAVTCLGGPDGSAGQWKE